MYANDKGAMRLSSVSLVLRDTLVTPCIRLPISTDLVIRD